MQVQRRHIEPLQVVEEERQRMFRPGEDSDEAPEHKLEASLRVLRRNLRDRRLFADDQLQFGNQIDDKPAERVAALRGAPSRQGARSASLFASRCRIRL